MKHFGYRVVAQTPQGLMTLYGRDQVNGTIGHIDQPGGGGLFLGNTPKFATDYYGGLTDYPDMLLTYEFDDGDLVKGDPDASSSELVVTRARLVGKTPLKESRKFSEELNDIRRRAGLITESEQILTLYHGSHIPIKKFDRDFSAQGVFWFSEDKDKILRGESGAVSSKFVMTCKVKIDKTAGWDEYEKLALDQIHHMGFDSIKLDDDWVIFDARRIKVVGIDER